MSLASLEESINKLPRYEKDNWSKYKDLFFRMVDELNYPKQAAVAHIAEHEGLSKEEQTKLYNASRKWTK